MALMIPLDISATPQTVPLAVGTPVEQTVNGDYEQLANLPQINGVTLIGDKSAADLGLEPNNIFVAEYGVTTYAEITAAKNAGKACFMRESELGLVAMYAEIGMGTPPGGSGMGSAYIFNATADGAVYSYSCWSSGVWSEDYSPIGTYSKPYGGIPKTDLAAGVRTSLGLADTALQTVPNTYRTAAAQDVIDAGKQATITASGILKGDGNGGVSAATAGTDYQAPLTAGTDYEKPVQQGSISLSATWSGNGPYTQPVTVTGATVTANSKVDLQPDATALAQLISDGVIALFITNNNGTLTATAIGAETTAALTIQCTVTEVTA